MTKRERKAANKAAYKNADILKRIRNTAGGRIRHVWLNQAGKARRSGDKEGCAAFLNRARGY